MATPDPVQLPPHTLSRLLKGPALWIVPMEPQPIVTYPVAEDDPYFREEGSALTSNLPGWQDRYAPYRVGDRVFLSKQGAEPGLLLLDIERDGEAMEATITGVETKRVREMDKPTQYLTMAPSGYWPKEWWNEQYPDHPFDTAWAWMIGLETKHGE